MKNYSILFWLIIIVLGVTLYFVGNVNNEETADVTPTPTPTAEATVSPTPTPVATYNPTPTPTPDNGQILEDFPDQGMVGETPPRSLITGPATCQLSNGKITFLSENTAMKEDAYISYQNVDHPGRLIFWSVDKEEEIFNIGPNIFNDMELPNGTRSVGVVIEGEPKYTEYILTAKVTYGIEAEGGGIIDTKEVDCIGTVTVELDYLK